MTQEQMYQFASIITQTNNRTIVTLNNGQSIVSFFDNNHDQKLTNENKWSFVETPIKNENNKYSIFNGDDISKIEIITL